MRLALALCLLCRAAIAQGQSGIIQYLGLSATQAASVRQLNDALNQISSTRQNRISALQQQLDTENAKASPDPLVLGQGYLELDSINRELSAARASVQTKVAALLTAKQILLLQQVSAAIVQSSLVADAGCGYLADVSLVAVPTFGFFSATSATVVSVNSGVAFATFFGNQATPACPTTYPISIRSYLALTDAEVSAILGLEAGYQSFKAQKDARTADVQTELNDETAKPTLDALALGVRYVELAEISQELTQADKTARAAARALLTTSQQMRLQGLLDSAALMTYALSAESCHFIETPPGTSIYDLSSFPCQLN